MKQSGPKISKHGVEASGFKNLAAAYWNLRPAELYEEAVRRGEGQIAADGPFVVKTGVHTGRSAKDKFIVRDATTENTVWWDNNKSMTAEAFDLLHADMLKHAEGKELFIQVTNIGGTPDRWHVSVNNPTDAAITTVLISAMALPGLAVDPLSITLAPGEYRVLR